MPVSVRKFFLMGLLASLSMLSLADDKADLGSMLDAFLVGAGTNSVTQHDNFWAEDLIYTSSSGSRFGKSVIMDGLNEPEEVGGAHVSYRAEDVDIRVFDTTAIVAFKLVGEETLAGKTDVSTYFNTGTFLKRQGRWQAVAWQATRIPAEQKEK